MDRAAAAQAINTMITEAMADREVKQSALAELIGVSQAQMSQRMNGRVPWKVAELDAVAKHLGIEVVLPMPVPPQRSTVDTEALAS